MYINEMQRISEAKKMSKRKIKILERKTGGSGPSQNHRLHFEEGQGGRGEEGGEYATENMCSAGMWSKNS
jgi:hypothetical protein